MTTEEKSIVRQRIIGIITKWTLKSGYIASWHINDELGIDTGMDVEHPSIGEEIKQELIKNGIIESIPDLGCRYRIKGLERQ